MMEKILEWDIALLHLINVRGANSWFDAFFPFITDLHKTLIFNLVAYPLFLGLFYWKYKRQGFFIFFGLLLCLGMSDFTGAVIKDHVLRLRPGDMTGLEVIVRAPYGGHSFISNHASNMFALATYSSLFVPLLTIPMFVIAFLIAYSRVYNGVHFPLDVMVGALLGINWGFLFFTVYKKIMSRKKRSK